MEDSSLDAGYKPATKTIQLIQTSESKKGKKNETGKRHAIVDRTFGVFDLSWTVSVV